MIRFLYAMVLGSNEIEIFQNDYVVMRVRL